MREKKKAANIAKVRAALTRSSSKRESKEDQPYIPRLPAPPARRFGKWQIYDISPKDHPDDDGDGSTSLPPPHPSLEGYWGNVDDRGFVYLFREPHLFNYQPIKLERNQILFKDIENVSHYLINSLFNELSTYFH